MGKTDIEQKLLTDYNDVFADIVNVLLFHGEQQVNEYELINVKDRSHYKAENGQLHEQERDLSKVWEKGGVRLSFVGVEYQMQEDKDMPIRVIGYDGASYRSQCIGKSYERYPVITLVLHFGIKYRWRTPKRLSEVINVQPKLKDYFSDYRINVFDIAFLTEEEVALFQSDFRVVADYFVQVRTTGDYKPSPQKLVHVDEVLKLFSVLTGDDRFREAQCREEKEGEVSMCEVLDRVEQRGIEKGIESMRATLDRVEQRGIEKGIAKGIVHGRKQGEFTMLVKLVRSGAITIETAAENAGMDREAFLRAEDGLEL